MKKLLAIIMIAVLVALSCAGCDLAAIDSMEKDFAGNIVGLGYTINCFDNVGNLVTTVTGDKINVEANYITEEHRSRKSGEFSETTYSETMTSVVTINIDGSQIVSCGDTLVFYENGIQPIYNFGVSRIESSAEDWTDAVLFSGMVNAIKNFEGKPVVVVIKSQTGYPIYAFAGEEVYWEIPDDLPKMTLLNIDGHRIYIHRANYQIIDTALLQ